MSNLNPDQFSTWIGDRPEEPTLAWRAPKSGWEVHVANHTPDRELRENYGSKPTQEVILYHKDHIAPPHPNAPAGSPPRGGWYYERNSNTGEHRYAPTAWGNPARGIPRHVQAQVDKIQSQVDAAAQGHADLYGQLAEHQDIASDLRRVPADMEAEAKAHRMFKNMLGLADEE